MAETLDLFTPPARGGQAGVRRCGLAGAAARPGAAPRDPSVGLDDNGWRRLAEGVARAAELARSRGYEPTFHHHTATYVEAPWEIERLLELTDVGLLLDTGHLALGSGDPVQASRDWGSRIDHVHIKDYRRRPRGRDRRPRRHGGGWRRRVFCELGTGDVDLPAFFAELAQAATAGGSSSSRTGSRRRTRSLRGGRAQARNRAGSQTWPPQTLGTRDRATAWTEVRALPAPALELQLSFMSG